MNHTLPWWFEVSTM